MKKLNDAERFNLLESLFERGIYPHKYNSGSAIWVGVEINGELISGNSLRDCMDMVYERQ